MKKLMHKVLRKKRPIASESPADSLRITNETVAEHRERILAAGRRFKYPHNYPRHRIVFITVSLVVVLLVGLGALIWWRLYRSQDTNDFMYSVTEIAPLPAARVDTQFVRYSDYLLLLRSALYYLSTKQGIDFSTTDGARQMAYQRRLALDQAIVNAYAQELAQQKRITVSNQELNNFITVQIKGNQLGVSQEAYERIVKDYYGWTFDEYRQAVRWQLLKVKVFSAIDVAGKQVIDQAAAALSQGQDFGQVAKNLSEDPISKPNGGDIGFVALTDDDPSGLIATAKTMQVGQTSGIISGIDGFYIIRLLDRNSSQVHLAKIFVAYKTFQQQLDGLKKGGKVQEYISVPAATTGQ